MKINFNEGGHVLTFFLDTTRRMARVWVKPDFWRASATPLFQRVWKW